jgi:hypothetical protein
METQEIRNVLDQGYAEGKNTFTIAGYTTSDGDIVDYRIEVIGSHGYKGLIRESLERLQSGKVTRPVEFPSVIWDAAVAEQITSWQRTLSGEQKPRAGAVMTPHNGYFLSEEKPDTVILRNCKKLLTVVRFTAKKATVNSSTKTLAKQYITTQTALDSFLGQLNLSPDRLESISILSL